MPETSRSPGPVLFGAENFRQGLVSALVAGAIALGANIYTDRGQNTTPKQLLGTGSYLAYTDAVCTNTGGLAKYTACSVQNPLTGTGIINMVQVDSYKAPNASAITCTTSPNGTATGKVIFKYLATASGRTVFSNPYDPTTPVTQNGSGSFALQLPPSWYVRCWHSTTPQPGATEDIPIKEQLRVWFNEQYVP